MDFMLCRLAVLLLAVHRYVAFAADNSGALNPTLLKRIEATALDRSSEGFIPPRLKETNNSKDSSERVDKQAEKATSSAKEEAAVDDVYDSGDLFYSAIKKLETQTLNPPKENTSSSSAFNNNGTAVDPIPSAASKGQSYTNSSKESVSSSAESDESTEKGKNHTGETVDATGQISDKNKTINWEVNSKETLEKSSTESSNNQNKVEPTGKSVHELEDSSVDNRVLVDNTQNSEGENVSLPETSANVSLTTPADKNLEVVAVGDGADATENVSSTASKDGVSGPEVVQENLSTNTSILHPDESSGKENDSGGKETVSGDNDKSSDASSSTAEDLEENKEKDSGDQSSTPNAINSEQNHRTTNSSDTHTTIIIPIVSSSLKTTLKTTDTEQTSVDTQQQTVIAITTASSASVKTNVSAASLNASTDTPINTSVSQHMGVISVNAISTESNGEVTTDNASAATNTQPVYSSTQQDISEDLVNESKFTANTSTENNITDNSESHTLSNETEVLFENKNSSVEHGNLAVSPKTTVNTAGIDDSKGHNAYDYLGTAILVGSVAALVIIVIFYLSQSQFFPHRFRRMYRGGISREEREYVNEYDFNRFSDVSLQMHSIDVESLLPDIPEESYETAETSRKSEVLEERETLETLEEQSDTRLLVDVTTPVNMGRKESVDGIWI